MVSSENNIVVGLQWGQEGKNRLLDFSRTALRSLCGFTVPPPEATR